MKMGRAAAIVACLVAGICLSTVVVDARGLKQSTQVFCSADSRSSLLITSGSGSARSSSTCQAEARAFNDIRVLVKDYVDSVFRDPDTGCTELFASEVVQGCAQAAASVFTAASVEVQIEGSGVACADAASSGDAFAVAVVDIIVDVSLEAIQDKFGRSTKNAVEEGLDKSTDSATGQATGRAVTAAISEAWAASSASVCTEGGAADEAQESFAERVREAIAFLYAEVALQLCSQTSADLTDLEEWASSLSDSDSFVTGEVQVRDVVDVSEGNASTDGAQVEQCKGSERLCCNNIRKRQDTCTCGINCELKAADTSAGDSSSAKLWENTDTKTTCLCP